MTDDLIARIETQLASVVTSSAGTPTEKTIRDHGRTSVCREDIEALIARVRALEAQAEIGRLAQEYVVAVNAEHETETLGLDQEAFEAEWDRRWDVADAAYERLREKVDVALAARDAGKGE